MPQRMAKLFISSALVFFIIGCIEGMMFPTKFSFPALYSGLFHVSPEHLKSFFGSFVAKIHTHVNLIGWVGSALMGILYFVVPQISGAERYTHWIAYGNWACQTVGVILLSVGFHLIGVFGLASGHAAGSPAFRAIAAPFKTLVLTGGSLITMSALLFAYNMLRSLFAKAANEDPERISASGRIGRRARSGSFAVLLLPAVLTGIFFGPVRPAAAGHPAVPERAEVIMIGDRLVDVAFNLGVVPAAMSVRCSMWSMCKRLQSTSQVLGCPKCLLKKRAEPLLKFAGKNNIKKVLIEKSDPFCLYMPDLQLETIAPLLDGKGLSVEYVDFTKGIEDAVLQVAAYFGKRKKADEILETYTRRLEKVHRRIGTPDPKKVLILNGIYQPSSGKSTLRVEAPGGYADRFLLEKLGAVNVGESFAPDGGKASKGHYPVKKKKKGFVLDALVTANPDAIVMTGDAFAVQKALAGFGATHPELAQVTAIRKMAVYALPGYVDAGVLEYPVVLGKWAAVLAP